MTVSQSFMTLTLKGTAWRFAGCCFVGRDRTEVVCPSTLYGIMGMWCRWAALVMFPLWFKVVSATLFHFPCFLWKWIINSSPHSRGVGQYIIFILVCDPGYLLYTLVWNPILLLFCANCFSFGYWEHLRSPKFFWHAPIIFFKDHILTLWYYKYYLDACPGMNYSFKDPWFLLLEMVFRNQDLGDGCACCYWLCASSVKRAER